MTGKQLKNSILQWAIQGKLVPQDPNDEPASVLLEKIRAEKARLVKEGKIKKDKNESIIYRGDDNSYYEKFSDGRVVCIDDEIPFNIPVGWEWCRMKTYMDVRDGTHDSPKYLTSGIPFVTSKNLTDGNIDFSTCKLISEEDHKRFSERSYVEDKDILFAMIGSIGNPVLVNKDRDFSIKNVALFKRYAEELSNQEYMLYYLSYIQGILREKASGGVQSFIGLNTFREWMFPLPPLAEQHRIVEKIQELLPIVEKYDSAQSRLKSLNKEIKPLLCKSILQEAVQGRLVPQDPADEPASALLQRIKEEKPRLIKEGKLKKKDLVDSTIFRGDDNRYFEKKGKDLVCIDEEIPFEIPDTWAWVRLSDVVQVNPKNDVPDNTLAAFIPMERIDATYLSSFTYSERKWGDIKSGFTHFADGDVAFAKITPCFQNRKSMILKWLPNGVGAGTTELKVLRPYVETIDREYLLFFLESSYFVEEATFKGTANQQRIISGYMENKLFPLPPLSEQHRISEKIKETYKRIGL